MERFRRPLIAALCQTALVVTAQASDLDGRRVTGPVAADILRIVDGDTILVQARPWPQQTVEVLVRIRGIDAPEIRARCAVIRAAAGAAKAHLAQLLPASGTVFLTNVSGDKYFGRVVADVSLADGSNPAQEMVAAGLALPYDGGRKAAATCHAGG